MAKILIVTSGLTGIFNASLQLMSRLDRSGHEVCSASPRQDLDFTKSPFPYYKLNPIRLESIISTAKDKDYRGIKGLIYRNLNRKSRRAEAIDIIEPKDFVPLLDQLKPDLVILDIELHEYIIQAYSCSPRILLLSQWFSVWSNSYLPSIQSELKVSNGNLALRIGNIKHYIKLRFKREKYAAKASLISGGLSRREIIISMAKKWKFPTAYIGVNLWPGQYLYNRLPVMSMTLKSLEFPHKMRSNLHYIGPMLDMNRNDSNAATTNSYTLEDAFQWAENKDLKIIYCSVSTMQVGDRSFIEKVISAVAEMPSWMIIISLGKIQRESDLSNLSDNVFTFNVVPQIEVLSRVDLSINHGGIHSINECIALNVPMLIYSGKWADQNGCASRMDYHEIAYIGDKDVDTVEEIRNKIESLYSDQNVRSKLEKINQFYNEEIKEGYLESMVEKILREDNIEN